MRRALSFPVSALLGVSLALAPLSAQTFRGAPRPPRSAISFALTPAAGCAYDTATCNYFSAMSVQPDSTRKSLLYTLVTCFESHGLFSVWDHYIIAAMHDSQAGLVDMITGTVGANNPSSLMVFTTDRGYKGNGTTARLLSNATLASSTHFGTVTGGLDIWFNIAPSAANMGLVGAASNTNTEIGWTSATSISGRINGTVGIGTTNPGSHHNLTVFRIDTSNVWVSLDGATPTSAASTNDSTSLTGFVAAGYSRGGYGDEQISAWGWGAPTSTNVTDTHACVSTYLTAIGAQ